MEQQDVQEVYEDFRAEFLIHEQSISHRRPFNSPYS